MDSPRERVLELLRRHAWNATAFQLLEPDFDYWFGEEACVGYVDTGGAWVAAGAPIADEERLGEACESFARAARTARRRAIFFAVEQRLLEKIPLDFVAVGEQPWWNPQHWSDTRRRHRSLREQIRRSRAKGVRIERVEHADIAADDAPWRRRIDRLIARWSATRPMPPMEFLVALHPFTFASERLYFVARRGEELAAVLVAVPIYQRNGWFFEDILRDPTAPNGTTEQLVDAAMEHIASLGCDYATLGLAPLAGAQPWLRLARRWLSGFYNFDGLRAFKAKLHPDGWDPIFLAFPRRSSSLVALFDTLNAFARGRILSFAFRSLFRASPFVLRLLAGLLIPWTLALALAPTRRWFPSATIQMAWTFFDCAVAVSLIILARRWRTRLAAILASFVTADAILTTVQAVAYDIPLRRSPLDWAVIGASLAAPTFAAAVLWGGVRRHLTPRS